MIKLCEKKIAEVLLSFIGEVKNKGCSGSYIASTVKTVKSWLKSSGINLTPFYFVKYRHDSIAPMTESRMANTLRYVKSAISVGTFNRRTVNCLMASVK